MDGQHDEREPEPSRDLSAAEERRVRALLAEARHTDPMPTDVAARLDRVIAGLSEGAPREADVVPLATRRRRASRLLLAAAAVVVLGVGGSQVLDGLGMAGSDDSGAGEASMPAAEEESGAEAGGEGGVAEDRANDQSEEAPVPSAATRVAKVRPRSFAADAKALRDGSAAFLGDANSARDADGRRYQGGRRRGCRTARREPGGSDDRGPDKWWRVPHPVPGAGRPAVPGQRLRRCHRR